MTMVYVGAMNTPKFICLYSDIVAGVLPGAARPGNTIFVYNTAEWYIIEPDSTLSTYSLPVNINLTGDVEIGAVEIKDATTTTRATVGVNGLAVDAYVNRIDQSVSESNTLSPIFGTQAVAVSGVAEPLASSSTKVIMAVVFTISTNTSDVYLGTAAVDKTSSKQMILQPGATVSIDAPLGFNFNLANLYVDAEISGEGVNYIAMR